MSAAASAVQIAGQLFVDGRLRPGRLHLAAGRIARVELYGEQEQAGLVPSAGAAAARAAGTTPSSAALASDAPILAPGLIDAHVHGFGGAEPLAGLDAMARALARAGTTAFQPTLFPAPPERLGAQVAQVAAAARALPEGGGARSLGIHLEGPFVNPRAAGALPPADLAEPSLPALRAILARATAGEVGTLTLAPELPGAGDLIQELVRRGVRVSLGHSLASAAQARAAERMGARGATHLYNAMGGFHHREAGLVGFALTADGIGAELIGDLVHVGREAVELALAARGPRELLLVSDALAGAGTGCERFHALGREHVLHAGAFHYPGPPLALAGGACSQLECVRRLVVAGVLALEEALAMATIAPARALGRESELGALAVGQRADLIELAPGSLELRRVWVGGHMLEPAQGAG